MRNNNDKKNERTGHTFTAQAKDSMRWSAEDSKRFMTNVDEHQLRDQHAILQLERNEHRTYTIQRMGKVQGHVCLLRGVGVRCV